MKEEKFRRITYDTTLAFAKAVLSANKAFTFCYVSGSHTDSSEKGKIMWARVKGKTENDLARLPFLSEYNFRPGVILPFAGQKNWKPIYKWLANVIRLVAPSKVLTIAEIGQAMVNVVATGYGRNVLEIEDIKKLARR
ncbi:MAG: hypothetical protein EOO03_13115 [Chitinophagaceae bacterium]|nr:MAG: hypothetical protein EOO03_13115 [Chitinophagaceae bacterium]